MGTVVPGIQGGPGSSLNTLQPVAHPRDRQASTGETDLPSVDSFPGVSKSLRQPYSLLGLAILPPAHCWISVLKVCHKNKYL